MFKKIIAITTSAVILLTPMQAGAVAWGDILKGLRAGDVFRQDQTTATRTKDGEYTIIGGVIDDIVSVGELQFSGALKVLFQNIEMDRMNAYASGGDTISIILDVGTKVKDRLEAIAHEENTNLSLVSVGEIGFLQANAEEKAQTTIENDGTIEESDNYVNGEGSRLEFINKGNGAITTGQTSGANGGGLIEVTNEGSMKNVNNWADGENSELNFENTEKGQIEQISTGANNGGTAAVGNSGSIATADSWASGKGSESSFTNEKGGTIDHLGIGSDNGGKVSAGNSGTIADADSHADGKDSKAEFVNEKDGQITNHLNEGAQQGGQDSVTNNGTIGSVNSWASGENSRTGFVNGRDGVVDALDASSSENGQTTIRNSGTLNGLGSGAYMEGSTTITNEKDGRINNGMFNEAMEKGESTIINNGTINGDSHNYAHNGGLMESTNNGTMNGDVMNQADQADSRNEATNNGTVNGSYSIYADDDGEAGGENNGTTDSFYVGADGGKASGTNNGKVREDIGADSGHPSIKSDVTVINNGEADRIYVSAGENGTLNLENNGRLTGDGETLIEIDWGNGEIGYQLSGEMNIDAWGDGATINASNNGSAATASVRAADGANASLNNDGRLGNGADAPLYGFAEGSGRLSVTGKGSLEPYTITMEDGSTQKVNMIARFDGNLSEDEIRQKVGGMAKFEVPGDYLVLTVTQDENGNDVYHYVPIHIEAEPAFDVPLADQMRHEMEMQRQEEAVGGVFGSPYWIRQMYLGYHSYNLRLYVGEKRANMREYLSWNADKTKGISFRVNAETPEKLTMRFDERVLEVFERTDITVITLMDKNGTPMMQYNVSDLRIAYDGFGLHDTDQLVVGGVDDEVMKIGADGQMVAAEE